MLGHQINILCLVTDCNRLQQFVNSLQQFRLWRASATDCNGLQQFATRIGGEDGSKATKNPVVEHKGSVGRPGVLFMASGRDQRPSPWDKIGRVFDECSTLRIQ